MESTRWEKVQDLFHQAAALPEAEREAFLRSACLDGDDLVAEVVAMLHADSGGPSILDYGLPGIADRVIGDWDEMAPVREIGPYKLVRILGEGGMGVVWLAQREDTGTLVAIKFLPHAGLSPARRERFAREIKTLAKLRHPYIARLYDAGTLIDGSPWFVMEYVEGERLTDYVRDHEHTVDQVLQLFRKVCEAVQYAHSQEIIHRDLKPSNILVEKDGTPRLLDFGIARELQGLDDPSEQTRPGLRFLSPDYAAPEWVRKGNVGFYTDVYSLGVILFELLTGRLPFDRPKRSTEDHHSLVDQVPNKPSSVAGAHSLSKAAWGDLDVVCLKALRSDPAERYQSVEALLRDLNHYLRSEPLEARPDSFGYRLGKFVRRNRRPVLAASLTLAAIVGMAVFFTVRLAKARNTALAQTARAQRIQKFMTDLFQGDDSEAGPSEDLRVITLLDRGVQKAQALNGEPEVQADLYRTLGGIYDQLGKYDKAETLFASALKQDRSLSQNDVAVSDDLLNLGLLYCDQSNYKQAESLVRQGLAIIDRHQPLEAAKQADATSALGRVLVESGQQKDAVPVLNHAILLQTRHDPTSAQLSDTLGLLAMAELYLGHEDNAEALNRRALEIDRKIYGENHPNVAADLINLGQLEDQSGRYAQAEQDDRQAVAITKAWRGPDNPDSARQSAILAQVLIHEGRDAQAETLLKYAFETEKHFFKPTDPPVIFALNSLGNVEVNRGDFAAAEDDFRQVISLYRAAYGAGDYRVGVGMSNLGDLYLRTRQYPDAERLLRQAIDLWKKVLPAGNIRIGEGQVRLGRALLGQHRYEEALTQSLAGYEILQKQTTPQASALKSVRQDLAAIYTALHQPEKAKTYQAELAAIQPPLTAAPNPK